jgi:hypothetical protein
VLPHRGAGSIKKNRAMRELVPLPDWKAAGMTADEYADL